MKFTQICILHVIFSLSASQVYNSRCIMEYDRSFNAFIGYYESRLRTCELTSAVKKRRTIADYEEINNLLASSTYENCYSLQLCNRLREELEAFNCLLKQTWENAQMYNNITYEAAQYSIELDDKMRLIDNEKYQCTNETVDQLAADSAEAKEELIKCNMGLTAIAVL